MNRVSVSSEPTRDGQLLSAAVKDLRKLRGLSAAETAAAMNMSLRTYQRFEAGSGRICLEHLYRFAAVTASDPYALLTSVAIGSSRYARNTADNLLSTILLIAIQKLEQSLGDRISELDTRTLVNAIAALIDDLIDHVLSPDPTKTWLETGRRDLNARRPKPGR